MALTEGALVQMLRQEPVSLPIVYVNSEEEIFDGMFVFKAATFDNYDQETERRPVVRKNGELVESKGAVEPGHLIQVLAYSFSQTDRSLAIESFNVLEAHHVLSRDVGSAIELESLVQCYAPDIVARFPLYLPRPFEGQLTPCIYDMCLESTKHFKRVKSKFSQTDRQFVQFLRVKKREFDSYDYVISDGQYYMSPSVRRTTDSLLLKMFDSKEIIEGTIIATNFQFERHSFQGSRWMSAVVIQKTADIIGAPKNIQVEFAKWWEKENAEREAKATARRNEAAREPFSRAQWTVPSVLSTEYVDRLDSIQWEKLNHAYGSAEFTAQNILDLASTDNEQSNNAVEQLLMSVLHQGSVYSSTPLAVESIANLLNESISEHSRKNALNTLHQIVKSCAIRLTARSKGEGDSKADSRFPWEEVAAGADSEEDLMQAVLKTLEPKLSTFVTMLHEGSLSNADKMYLCSVLSSLVPSENTSPVVSTVVSTVLGMVQSGKEDEVVTAALLDMLAAHAAHDAVVRGVLDDYLSTDTYPLLCRIAVALRMAKTLKTEAPVSCLNLLDECISSRHVQVHELLNSNSPTYPSWLNQYLSWHIDFVKALAALGVRGVPVVTKNLKRLFRGYYDSNIMERLDSVMKKCFTKTLGDPNPDLNHLTPIQRDLLKEIASLPARMDSSKRNRYKNSIIKMAGDPKELKNTVSRMLRNYGLPYRVVDLTSLVSRSEAWDRRRTAILVLRNGSKHPLVDALRALPPNLFRHMVKFI
eukprot:GILJ01003481.1.p1 GENE.GILJ01003481.1~~GILJ01003481.1.p1  ORF type:complete len:771 (-),score=128.73 GILJ01003481.1:159-2429(-)